MTETQKKIATLNDLARTAMGVASRLVQTCGISALPPADQSAIREKVETFNTVDQGNNPDGERAFGAVEDKTSMLKWDWKPVESSFAHGEGFQIWKATGGEA